MPLSARQLEYPALAWQCFESDPKIDLEKFASVAGLASAASARELLRVTKKKLREEYGALSGAVQSSKSNASGTPKKQQQQKATNMGTPTSTGKKRGRTPAAGAAAGGAGKGSGSGGREDVGGEDDDEEGARKKAKTNGIKVEPREEDGGALSWDGDFLQ